MQQLCKQCLKLIYVSLLTINFYHYKVTGQGIDEDLIPELFKKYEEAVRSNETSTDSNMVSSRRLFKHNKEYSVHVKKLKEVNGYKRHNLLIKGSTRTNDSIIYINNPVESKIPNAFLTLEEFKKVLTDRLRSKKDAYSILHATKQYGFGKFMSFAVTKSVSHFTTRLPPRTLKIQRVSKMTSVVVTKVNVNDKKIANKTSLSTLPYMLHHKEASRSHSVKNSLKQAILQTYSGRKSTLTVKNNDTKGSTNTVLQVEKKSYNVGTKHDKTNTKVTSIVIEKNIPENNVGSINSNKTVRLNSEDLVTISANNGISALSAQTEITGTNLNKTETSIHEEAERVDNYAPTRTSKFEIITSILVVSNKSETNEVNANGTVSLVTISGTNSTSAVSAQTEITGTKLNKTETSLDKEVTRIDNHASTQTSFDIITSILEVSNRSEINEVNANGTESNVNNTMEDVNNGELITVNNLTTVSATSALEETETIKEETTQEPYRPRWTRRTASRMTKRTTTRTTRRTYGRPRVFMGG